MKQIKGMVIVVMGASSGIGKLTCIRLAEKGAKVVISGNNKKAVDDLRDEIITKGGDAISVAAEVTDFSQVDEVGRLTVATYGRLDAWVHTAAVFVQGSVENTTVDEYRRVMDVNFIGQVIGAKVAIPLLRASGGGSLIHLSSVEARRSPPLQSAYASSKHALDGFIEALRIELMNNKDNINIVSILPASIDTPIYLKSKCKEGRVPQPFPPVYSPELVVDAIERALENPKFRDIFVGTMGWVYTMAQKIVPTFMDWIFSKTQFGFTLQKSNQVADEDYPNNLYKKSDITSIDGGFNGSSISLYDWWKELGFKIFFAAPWRAFNNIISHLHLTHPHEQ